MCKVPQVGLVGGQRWATRGQRWATRGYQFAVAAETSKHQRSGLEQDPFIISIISVSG